MVYPFPNDKLQTISNSNSLQTTILNFNENGRKILLSNLSFSHSVFERLVLQTCKSQGSFEERLSPLLHEQESLSVTVFAKDLLTN